jgi:hypothetical protein
MKREKVPPIFFFQQKEKRQLTRLPGDVDISKACYFFRSCTSLVTCERSCLDDKPTRASRTTTSTAKEEEQRREAEIVVLSSRKCLLLQPGLFIFYVYMVS